MDMIKQITLRIGKALKKAVAYLKAMLPVRAAVLIGFFKKAAHTALPYLRKAAAGIVPLCDRGLQAARKHRYSTTAIACVLTLTMLMSVVTVNIFKIRVFDGENEVISYYGINTDEESILKKSGLTLHEADAFDVSENNGVITATVTRAYPVQITADGNTATVMMIRGTVAEAMALANVTVDSDDLTSIDPNAAVYEGLEVVIDRVNSETVSETVSVDYDTVKEKTNSLYVGETEVKQEGKKGEKVNTYSVTYTNGVETDRELIDSEITKEPVDKIILVGTKVKSSFKTTSSTPTNYVKRIAMTATAYKQGGYTASGLPARVGVVSVDPRVIPLGTKVYVESEDGKYIYGTAIAADTGGAIKGNKIDLCLASSAECRKFGRRTVNVYILE